MDKELEKLEVECQENEDDTIRLEDYPPDKQALVSIRDDWGTSELYISVEDAKKMRDWWIAFCEKYENNDILQNSLAHSIEDDILKSIVDQMPKDINSIPQQCPMEYLKMVEGNKTEKE